MCHVLLFVGDTVPTNGKNKKGLSNFINVPRIGRAFLTLSPGQQTDSLNSDVDISYRLEYFATLLGDWCPTFRNRIVGSSSGVFIDWIFDI